MRIAAGTYGVGLLSIAATARQGFDVLGTHWQTWNEVADQHGHTADREQWRLVGPMHLAETKEQARKDVEYGIVPFSHYFTHVLPAGPVRGDTAHEIIDNVDEDGFAVIGTPDDAIRKIQELVDQSGGFGTFLLFGHDWATPEATKRSFELFAQYVMPHFKGQLDWPQRSTEWVTGSGGEFVGPRRERDHASDRGPRGEQADELRFAPEVKAVAGSCPRCARPRLRFLRTSPRDAVDLALGAGLRMAVMDDLIATGQFSALTWLSPKALRLYQAQGLLEPAWIDPRSGYRYYSPAQISRAARIGLFAARRDLPRRDRVVPRRTDD